MRLWSILFAVGAGFIPACSGARRTLCHNGPLIVSFSEDARNCAGISSLVGHARLFPTRGAAIDMPVNAQGAIELHRPADGMLVAWLRPFGLGRMDKDFWIWSARLEGGRVLDKHFQKGVAVLVRCTAQDKLDGSVVHATGNYEACEFSNVGITVPANHSIENFHELLLWPGEWALSARGHVQGSQQLTARKHISVTSGYSRELVVDLSLR
jgi:hypothetical protein